MKPAKSNRAGKIRFPAAGEAAVDLERRRLTTLAAMALLGGTTITLTSCSGGAPTGPSAGSPAPPAPACAPDAACGQVTGDATHSAVITGAQLAAGGGLILDISGTSNHAHTVALSADDVAAIREKRRVEKLSSVGLSHNHLVTFN